MRILIITTNVVKWGGSEELWCQVAEQCLAAGHEVMVSSFMHKPVHQKILKLKKLGAKIHLRPFPSYYIGQRFTGRALAEVKLRLGLDNTALDWQPVKRWQPQSVLISSGETFDYNINERSWIIRHCAANKIPYYLMSQFNWEHDMSINDEFRRSRAKLNQQASGHFFVSYRNFRNAEMQLAQKLERVRIISNPIKLDLPEAIPYPSSSRPRLAMVARFQSFIKGQDLLLQSLADDYFRNIDFELNLYGKGDDKEHLEQLIQHYQLQGKVFIHKHEDDVKKVWEHNQLAILSSRAEGTSLAMLEAMYCGRAPLVSVAGDSGIWAQKNGFVAASNTVESLKPTLKKAFAHYEEWKTLGLKARDTILKNHNFDQAEEIKQCLVGQVSIEGLGKSPSAFLAQFETGE
jgi:glycosyltransferase involved in cell wall biosynthesis